LLTLIKLIFYDYIFWNQKARITDSYDFNLCQRYFYEMTKKQVDEWIANIVDNHL